MPESTTKTIHILGGGVAGCTAAYWLTREDGWEKEYEIHLYQSGWRLGGKGASGRNSSDKRSFEHGPHAWYGGYENAFRTMRGVFDHYTKHGEEPHGPFKFLIGRGDNALFRPSTEACYMDYEATNDERAWNWVFPLAELGEPGDGSEGPNSLQSVVRLIKLIFLNLKAEGLRSEFNLTTQQLFNDKSFTVEEPIDLEEAIIETLESPDNKNNHLIGDLLIHRLRKSIKSLHSSGKLSERLFVMSDFMIALTAGYRKDIQRGKKSFDDLNNEEFQAWLKRHGACFSSGDSSRFVLGLYDAAFAYSGGTDRNLAAGTALRISLWIFFGYKESYIYKMQAGMGETVFTPFHEVLKNRPGSPGVHFHFFHRATEMKLNESKDKIASIKFSRQAEALSSNGYNPLIDISKDQQTPFLCWPEAPKWNELKDGVDLSNTDSDNVDLESRWTAIEGTELEIKIEDGDLVLLALPAPALPELMAPLRHSEAFATMLDTTESVSTLAAQFWLKKEATDHDLFHEYGFKEQLIGGGSPNPLGILLDYSPTLQTEDDTNHHLLYACGVYPDPPTTPTPSAGGTLPEELTAEAKNETIKWLEKYGLLFLTHLRDSSGNIDWSRLGGNSSDFWQRHYCRINFDGSSRYILSTVNSIQHRLTAKQSGFENLILAGDWTKTGIDLGCVEAAVTSGMLAVEAITGKDLAIQVPYQKDSTL